MSNAIMIEGFASILATAKVKARKAAINVIESAIESAGNYQPDTDEDPNQAYCSVLGAALKPHLSAALDFCRSDEFLTFIALDYDDGIITVDEVFSKLVFESFKNVTIVNDNDND